MDKIKHALAEKQKIGFEVTNPQKTFAGHTVYRLQLKIYDASDGSNRYEVIGWKRYNDFKKLHKELKVDFPDDIKLSFPVFPKGKIFGRFEESVIEERKQTCINFLQFIVSHREMLFHQSFQKFVKNECQKSSRSNKEESSASVSYAALVDDLVALTDNDADQKLPSVEGSNNEESGDDVSLAIENYGVDERQTWLREARSICESDIDLEDISSDTYNESIDNNVFLNEPLNNETAPSPVSSDDCDSLDQPKFYNTVTSNDTGPIDQHNEVGNFHQKFELDDRMSKIIEEAVQHDDYVFQASVSMSNAKEQEELGNHEAAFDLYKFGIGLLLRGVQGETNIEKREAVRRKTAQYLMRAEQLYKSSFETVENNSSKVIPLLGDGKWRFRLSDVKVFGIIRNVMLVQKVFSGDVYVMKVLHKQDAEYKRTFFQDKIKQNVPRNLYNCHFMTKLISCVETQTGVYLLLEYISGGRLWDFLELPIFSCGHKRTLSFNHNENHHSWKTSITNNNSVFDVNCTDVINIHCKRNEKDISRETSSTSSKVEKLPSQINGYPEDFCRLWAAQIALALLALHSHGIICRDLNPKNILIDSQGNIKLTYFSNISGIDYTLDSDAIAHLYTSPEVDHVSEINKATDWWSYGAILFEILMGESLYSSHPKGINNSSIISLPRRVSTEACSLLASLLQFNPRDRLGAGPNTSDEIKAHPFFVGIDWKEVETSYKGLDH